VSYRCVNRQAVLAKEGWAELSKYFECSFVYFFVICVEFVLYGFVLIATWLLILLLLLLLLLKYHSYFHLNVHALHDRRDRNDKTFVINVSFWEGGSKSCTIIHGHTGLKKIPTRNIRDTPFVSRQSIPHESPHRRRANPAFRWYRL